MRLQALGIVTALLAGSALGQALLCPPPPTPPAHACDAFHYHVQLYRPDTRGFIELYGINQFATQGACERARDAAMKRSLAVVDYYRRERNDQRYEPDRVGPCHCDMTVERTSSNYLTDTLRLGQLRLAAEVRMRVRERLMDAGLPTDSELIRGLQSAAPAAPLLGGPKLVPLPSAPAVAAASNAPSDLKMPSAPETTASATSLDLPLAEIATAAPPPALPPAPVAAPAVAAAPPVSVPSVVPPATAPPPPVVEVAETPPAPPPAPPPPPSPPPAEKPPAPEAAAPQPPPAEEAAEAFISVETDRIQKVLGASGALADDGVRVKVLEACSQRIQLLSNLRTLIEGSGAKSRLTSAARDAHDEGQRLAFVAKLFGGDMPSHWAPKDARDVIVELPPDPEKVLRDAGASALQKGHALYALLATASPTEEQQAWLVTVVEGLLQ